MKIEDLFTPEELVLIDSGEYRPGRAALDAKLDLCAAIEREACARVCDAKYEEYPDEEMDLAFALSAYELAAAIRARGQA